MKRLESVYVLAISILLAVFAYNGANVEAQRRGTAVELVGDSFTLRAASGALTAGESTTAVTNLGGMTFCTVQLNVTTITTADADDEVDFYLQTSYDDGTTWADLENVHYDMGDTGTTATVLLRVGATGDVLAADTAAARTDGALADGSKLKIYLGDRLRFKTAVTGATAPTYAYNSTAYCR